MESITEVGVDWVTSRTWSYSWDGDDLIRIEAPDGTALEMAYDDPAHPGVLTLVERVGALGGRRVLRGWTYDAQGNVIDTWVGDLSPTGPAAVDRWQLSFDVPDQPAQTTVTDPLGNVSTYTLGRDEVSNKPKLLELAGGCPGCGLGPNTQLVYEDPAHPLRPTREIDGEGNETRFTYDAHGQRTSRTEAFATLLERTTTWDYHPTYPALVTLVSRPSVAGGGAMRETLMSYNASGDLIQRTESGMEAGAPFSLITGFTPNAAGRTAAID